MKVKKRMFLVGAARSGTTLLQSILASHSDIFSPPETHFFSKTIKGWRKKRPIPYYGLDKRQYIRKFLQRINAEDLNSELPFLTFSKKNWAKSLINILDKLAIQHKSEIWLEKTPMHLYYIDLITKISPHTKFIHIIRNGEDVVASLQDAYQSSPQHWLGSQNIDQCISRWKKDILVSQKYIGSENHIHLRFEELLNSPEEVLKVLCTRIGIDYEDSMLSFQEKAKELIFEEEKWKKHNVKEIKKTRKFLIMFSEAQQQYILDRTSNVNLTKFNLIS